MATTLSSVLHLNSRFGVKIVSTLPIGIPTPSLPTWTLIPKVYPSAIGIAVVVLAVHISLAKMFSKKMNYKIDPGQVRLLFFGKIILAGTLRIGTDFFIICIFPRLPCILFVGTNFGECRIRNKDPIFGGLFKLISYFNYCIHG